MDFSFGIVTGTEVPWEVVKSIIELNIPNYEIIIVGGKSTYSWNEHVKHVEFDENAKPGWITRKKNVITERAKFENIVYLHDYYIFDKDWYGGFLKFGNDWEVCMNKIQNADGTRFRDWCVWDDPDICYPNGKHRIMLPPYTYNKINYMYVSGGYWVAKKSFMNKHKLDESLCWGESEDVEWSKRIRGFVNYKMNEHSAVHTTKNKKLSAEYI